MAALDDPDASQVQYILYVLYEASVRTTVSAGYPDYLYRLSKHIIELWFPSHVRQSLLSCVLHFHPKIRFLDDNCRNRPERMGAPPNHDEVQVLSKKKFLLTFSPSLLGFWLITTQSWHLEQTTAITETTANRAVVNRFRLATPYFEAKWQGFNLQFRNPKSVH